MSLVICAAVDGLSTAAVFHQDAKLFPFKKVTVVDNDKLRHKLRLGGDSTKGEL